MPASLHPCEPPHQPFVARAGAAGAMSSDAGGASSSPSRAAYRSSSAPVRTGRSAYPSGTRPPIHSQSRDSSKIRSAMPAVRASARPSSSASSQRAGSRPRGSAGRPPRRRTSRAGSPRSSGAASRKTSQPVAERRCKVRPDDRADRGVEDQGRAQVPAEAAVEGQVPVTTPSRSTRGPGWRPSSESQRSMSAAAGMAGQVARAPGSARGGGLGLGSERGGLRT